jgi:hypothetical protein
MTAVTKILLGGAGIAALATAAPAAAQYYPDPYGYGAGPGAAVGQVINQVLGQGYGGQGYYGGRNSQMAVERCSAAVTQRINAQYGARYGGYGGYRDPYGGYGGGYSPYGGGYNNGYGAGRVLSITRVEPRSYGTLRVRGYATTGLNSAYSPYGAYGGYTQQPADLKFKCDVDYRGYIRDIDLDRNRDYNGYGNYGYRRY